MVSNVDRTIRGAFWAELGPPQKDLWRSSPPVSQDVTSFGNRVFANVVKTRTFRRVLLQRDSCPYNNLPIGHRDRQTPSSPRDVEGGEQEQLLQVGAHPSCHQTTRSWERG